MKDFGRASLIFGFVVRFIDFGLLRKDGELYKLKDRDEAQLKSEKAGNGKENPRRKSVWGKFKDSLELWLFNLRGLGWNWEVGGIPKREPQSFK